jgi:tryptophan halogenase
VEISAKFLAERMPANREVMDIVARRFNDVTLYRWGRIIDFLKLHYVLTRRTDTAFWRDNVDPVTVPERLKELLKLWQYQSPWFFDEFDRLEEVFPAASYQYVLYGMGYTTEVTFEDTSDTASLASRLREENERLGLDLRARLPKNRELLDKIYAYGLQSI